MMIILTVIVLTSAIPFPQYIQTDNSEIVPLNKNLQLRNRRESNGVDGYYLRKLFGDGSDYDNNYDSDRYDGPVKPTRYHYNPVVKYTEQKHRRHKFFVPNLWGWEKD